MIQETKSAKTDTDIPVTWVHTLVIGSGAAGLNAALQLHVSGVEDVCIVTEGLEKGTSINTGSDKQTYYKLSMCGADADAPAIMADSYFAGGSMHGDVALVEAALSARAFINLVNLGVPFPRDEYGQFVGYKTDHDPRQRATSIGPYTSREMCRALMREIKRKNIVVREDRIAVQLLTQDNASMRRCCGALVLAGDGTLEAYGAENVVFATGGPGGCYKTSVYPTVHTGGIGVALLAGAGAQSLPESQYGLASIRHRWNVSGTYMQVIPRFTSTLADGVSDPLEFLPPYFASVGAMNAMVFLKGYQWPFDARKAIGGSSIIDILVYQESVIKGRRVFLDFRKNPHGFSFDSLGEEARTYLEKSGALQETPIDRLRNMNPGAIELYKDNGIDITMEPLEVAVCAQHNNGGLAVDYWWESPSIKHLFPVGEVAGTHGVYRPGGSALNSGQVAGFRAAEIIAHRYREWTIDREKVCPLINAALSDFLAWSALCKNSTLVWAKERENLQARMSRAGAHIRSRDDSKKAAADAWEQWRTISARGMRFTGNSDQQEAAKTRYLCFAHAVYLDAIAFALESGMGSRGSAIVLDKGGIPLHEKLGDEWRIIAEDSSFREKVLETDFEGPGIAVHHWVDRRPVPTSDAWFEKAWARFQSGEIYK
jgi:succinate dehydrogenase/fumarate reductase flavoprotein subunit